MQVGEVSAKITLDDKQYNKSLDHAEKSFKGFADKAKSIGQKLTMGLTLPILGAATACTKLAMEAVESENLFEVSFGSMAKTARAWSEELSASLGLNAYELRKTSATFYVMFDAMKMGTKSSYDMSTGLTELAYDKAPFSNHYPTEAF